MFDNKEISKRALMRAYESKARKRRFKLRSIITSACMTVLVLTSAIMIVILPVFNKPADYGDYYEEIDQNKIPLGEIEFPTDGENCEKNNPSENSCGCSCISCKCECETALPDTDSSGTCANRKGCACAEH